MAIIVPQPGQEISATDFGAPVANQLNGIIPTVWTVLTLSASWTHQAGQSVSYRKVGDMVQLRGRMDGGLSNTTVFTLPTGYRPPFDVVLAIAGVASGAWGAASALLGATGALSILTVNTSVAFTAAYSVTP
jgi:hypothetical protein